MGTCLITGGIERGCNSNAGGIKRVLIQNKSEITAVTPALAGDTTGQITNIALNTGGQFFQFDPTRDSCSFTQTSANDSKNGASAYDQLIVLAFKHNEASLRNKVMLLAQSLTLAIVEDRNGRYWLVGEEEGLETFAVANSGVVLTDLNGYTLEMKAPSVTLAREIYVTSKALTDAYIATLLEPAV